MDNDNTYQKVKDAIKFIIDKYGILKVKYGFVIFGTMPVLSRRFNDPVPSRTALKSALDSLPNSRGQPDLRKGLQESEKLFTNATKPINVRRVLVVIVDKNSINSAQDLKNIVQSLEKRKVLVIPVAIGSSPDPRELQSLTPNKGYMISVPQDHDPITLGQEIMKKAIKGENKV